MMRLPLMTSLLVVAFVSGCASLPPGTSKLDGSLQLGRADPKLYPVRVVAVDGQYLLRTQPAQVEPGQRVLKVETVPVAGFNTAPDKLVTMKIEPCRYYDIAARRDNPLKQDFELVTLRDEPMADCVMPR